MIYDWSPTFSVCFNIFCLKICSSNTSFSHPGSDFIINVLLAPRQICVCHEFLLYITVNQLIFVLNFLTFLRQYKILKINGLEFARNICKIKTIFDRIIVAVKLSWFFQSFPSNQTFYMIG